MSDIVFVLGAGASRHAGAPLMYEFLDFARDRFVANPNTQYSSDLDRVFRAVSRLQAVHSKAELDLVNLESVFSTFEMAELLDVPPKQEGLVLSMKRLIEWTLNECMVFRADNSGGLLPSEGYSHFASAIRYSLDAVKPYRSCAVITFNYDVGMDLALTCHGLAPGYCLNGESPGGIKLLKLHGSINWAMCPTCRKITPSDVQVGNRAILTAGELAKMPMLRHRKLQCCANDLLECFIVPPSWNKGDYHSSLVPVWRQAARELKEASVIVICGYSLPETDSFFRYLYALGAVGDTLLRQFWVIDPSSEVRDRFKNLLGPGARQRFRFDQGAFEHSIPQIQRILSV